MKDTSIPFAAPFFNEFVAKAPRDSAEILVALEEQKIIGGFSLQRFYPELGDHLLVCVTETASRDAIDRMIMTYREKAAAGNHAHAEVAIRNANP